MRFLFDGTRINPAHTPKDVRSATRPASEPPPARSRARITSREVPRIWVPNTDVGEAKPPSRIVSLENLTRPLSPPSQLDMEDGDSIDAMMEQVGGR